ncbi:hypothetical protein PF010_g25033 [Phytophthora fragariae]|uniref:Crinkler effector protein N-terminal domain-containing protein n=1 Tax=Phytophthora fragariae TaxID=53985 RepID=A0A6G0K0V8_9STRA|nr:hypothetical protein PF010_g25033 [Phytophthora fragariae]
MVKLVCAIVGVAASAFSVEIDESKTLEELTYAIKALHPVGIKCDAMDLQLFLAKRKREEKGSGKEEWLTEREEHEGVTLVTTSTYHIMMRSYEPLGWQVVNSAKWVIRTLLLDCVLFTWWWWFRCRLQFLVS